MAHNNFYLDLCVDVYVVEGDAVLLRLHDKYNYWGAPGGHLDAGEDVNDAARREVYEEVGLRVTLVGPAGWEQTDSDHNRDLVPPHFVNRHPITSTHDHSAFIFIARATSRTLAPQAVEDQASQAECRWLTRAALMELKAADERLGVDTYRYAMVALDLLAPSR